LTSSPDFFRNKGGFISSEPSSSDESSDPCMGESVMAELCCERVISLEDRECEIFRASGVNAGLVVAEPGVEVEFFPSSSPEGECSRFWSIDWWSAA